MQRLICRRDADAIIFLPRVRHGRDARATLASWHGRPGHAKT